MNPIPRVVVLLLGSLLAACGGGGGGGSTDPGPPVVSTPPLPTAGMRVEESASFAARVIVDAFDVTTPGRRYEEYEPSIRYAGMWTPHNDARVWSEGATATSNVPGATATFTFTGTSVSWIGCEKGSAGGTAKVFIDGTLAREIRLSENYPIEGYQKTVFRADGLASGPHTLVIEVTNTDGSYVVVDAFDVRS